MTTWLVRLKTRVGLFEYKVEANSRMNAIAIALRTAKKENNYHQPVEIALTRKLVVRAN